MSIGTAQGAKAHHGLHAHHGSHESKATTKPASFAPPHAALMDGWHMHPARHIKAGKPLVLLQRGMLGCRGASNSSCCLAT